LSTSIDIATNLNTVRERLAQAAARAERSPDEVTLVAVSKTHPVPLIREAIAAGQLDFGENRVEDAWTKFVDPDSQSAIGGSPGVNLHLIGPIQSRKAALAVACRPALIHAVDRLKVARRLDRFAAEAGCHLDILLEVNVSGEESKFGFTPDGVQAAMNELLQLPMLRVRGLMTMPPYDPDPELARPFFVQLRQLRDRLAVRWPEADLRHLSMGMSDDFAVAIEEGATIVRVGTAIFGARSR
jgi:pyridoxal phosphate enzyme (YggS family)